MDYQGRERRSAQRAIELKPHPHDASEPCPGGCADIDVVTASINETRGELLKLEERLQESHEQLARFEGRLAEGDARIGRIEKTINENSSAMTQNSSDTREILQIMRDTKAAFKMIGHLGMAIKWVAGIAVAIGSVWLLIRDANK